MKPNTCSNRTFFHIAPWERGEAENAANMSADTSSFLSVETEVGGGRGRQTVIKMIVLSEYQSSEVCQMQMKETSSQCTFTSPSTPQ